MLLTNRFSWFGAGALGVKRQRTGLKLGSDSEPALELPWWKRGKRGLIQGLFLAPALFIHGGEFAVSEKSTVFP